jgi:triacylglycerol esterase/lipase EstA (alpha/beta hydrolase family)
MNMGFGEALDALKQDERLARDGWNGRGMWVAMVPSQAWSVDDDNRVLGRAFLCLKTADGAYVPWTASQTDLLAEDWRVVD